MTPAGDVPAVMAQLSAGDLAWWEGDRRTAVHAWREVLAALTATDTARSPEPASDIRAAAEAMVRIRLLQVDGNFGPFQHEGPLRAALTACPMSQPWCAIAQADFDLFMPSFTGADPARVSEDLSGCPLTGPAAGRLAAASGDTRALTDREDLDGMGQGIRETGRLRPPNPGTWFIGAGVAGAPGAGAGVSVRFDHPDLEWGGHHLQVTAAADSLGGWTLGAGLATATRPSTELTIAAGETRGALWEASAVDPYRIRTGQGSLGIAVRQGALGARLGGSGRVDDVLTAAGDEAPGARAVVGPYASVVVGDEHAWARGGVETGFGGYTHAGWTVDARSYPTLLGGTLALRAVTTVVTTPDSPSYRLPEAGGATLLRGESAGRYRGTSLVAGQMELRHPIAGPIYGAAFVDSARVSDAPDPVDDGTWHWTVGGGVRLVLPPEHANVTRLDVGFGPGTWGIVFALGEAF